MRYIQLLIFYVNVGLRAGTSNSIIHRRNHIMFGFSVFSYAAWRQEVAKKGSNRTNFTINKRSRLDTSNHCADFHGRTHRYNTRFAIKIDFLKSVNMRAIIVCALFPLIMASVMISIAAFIDEVSPETIKRALKAAIRSPYLVTSRNPHIVIPILIVVAITGGYLGTYLTK